MIELRKPGCPDCPKADATPRWGGYTSTCDDCACRMLAQTPQAWQALKGVTNAPLVSAMDAIANRDPAQATLRFKAIRQRVWHWIGELGLAKAAQR